ncbi:XdhC family protein [Xanthobacter autotrophicus]|jgi:xanthine dehydrogenase accessory factor|uniref:XdhC family protein n=1 Tax=Xanthobacter autotrophicus TaxID=280 RepID=A0A6C1KYC7_XANAU|nr:XdhC family protein [Xanthobacter autotrophicus]TLX44953.1 XdhC family protein [Xanthobacter autotrophicus]
MRLELLAALNAERAARRACVVVTELASGAQRLVGSDQVDADPLAGSIHEALALRRSRLVGEGERRAFLAVEVPPPRMLVIGAVHISQALAPMARLAGFDLTIIDPRTAFATPERFGDVPVIAEWPEVALPAYGLDPFTALVALTHDPKVDEPALVAGLKVGCFYVGALGSRRTHARRVERLQAAGLSPDLIGRIHAPIGIDIGAASPAEIAVAVLAEVIRALRSGVAHAEGVAA